MKQILNDMTQCCGCRACEKCCPKAAISMQADADGFFYPQIDQRLCIDCKLCECTCPMANPITSNLPQKVYAVYHKQKEVLLESSSGGAFTALANLILEKGGAVVGCAFDEKLCARQKLVEDKTQLSQLRGSKYVQSDTADTFEQVQKLLQQDRYVVYTGTPCQIAGLRAFLHKEYEKLLTVDFVCHGVPSPNLFAQHISWVENRYGGVVKDYRFRSKSNLRQYDYQYTIKLANSHKSITGSAIMDPYYFAFLQKSISRESCYGCPYAQEKRVADFTLADYWNVQRFHPTLRNINGVSILLINTPKAVAYQHELENELEFFQSELTWAKTINANLNKPSKRPSQRNEIYKTIQTMGYPVWANGYCATTNWKLRVLYHLLPAELKALLYKSKSNNSLTTKKMRKINEQK